MLKNLE